MSARALWKPDAERIAAANLTRFIQAAARRSGRALVGYDHLYAWSIDDRAGFWEEVWRFADVRSSSGYTQVLGHDAMPGAEWFPGARLNFAENLLRFQDDRIALVFVDESESAPVELTYAELHLAVARFAHWLRSRGVVAGDRVAALMPNRIEAVVAMLAATSLGAIWSSCSPDFGFRGVMDRFGQIQPKVLLTADGYRYNGRGFDSLARAVEVRDAISTIEHLVVVPVLGTDLPDGATSWSDALDNGAIDLDFAQLPFDHPVYIMYSSGTTGVPKCIVHGAGGTLLQHAKELLLHTDLGRDDAIFYFTTCGWMMWNWLVSSLVAGCRVVLFDGSPSHPDLAVLWRMAARVGVTVFGTSPKFLTSCAKAGVHPARDHDLSALRAMLSTGSPLSVENFEWVYEHVGTDLQLASICGGTDIISCFMLGSPIDPVFSGEIQKRGLGMAVEAWTTEGDPVVGAKGELVCTRAFPSMPVAFWNDPDGSRYDKAYFRTFPGVWRHGDYVEITPRGGVIVYGRSDATLNPGGVRIGTAEIYRIVEALPEVVDSVVVGQQWLDDVRVVLFVVLAPNVTLDDPLVQRIRTAVRSGATPRHMPARVLACPDVPRTISGKKVEIAVTRLLHGEDVPNRDALKNPEALDFFASEATRDALQRR